MSKLKELVTGAGKTTKDFLEKAAKSADKDGDGKFNLSDMAVVANSVSEKAKSGMESVKETVDEKSKEHQINVLQPIFAETLEAVDFSMPKFIRIIDRDKKHAESELCAGSVGHFIDVKKQHVVNLYKDSLSNLNINFYPDCDSELYYVDPSDRNSYIALNEYFNYMKVARINELQRIARDLGAKYFKVTYKEEQVSFTGKKAKAKIQAQDTAELSLDHDFEDKKYYNIEIKAESKFSGKSPEAPTLKYLKKEPEIQSLIEMRLNATSPLLDNTYMLKLSNSSGMKEKDAIQIDAILGGLKYKGNATVTSEFQNESRRYLEYKIEF